MGLTINTGFSSQEEAERCGYIAAQIKRISDGSILHMNPDETYSFKESAMSSPYKYSLDMLLNDKFEVQGWVKKRNSQIMKEKKIVDYIDSFLYSMVIKFIDSDDKKRYLSDCFTRLCLNIEEKYLGQFEVKWSYKPFEEPVNVVSTYSEEKVLIITIYEHSSIPIDSYKINLSSLRRDYKINKIINED